MKKLGTVRVGSLTYSVIGLSAERLGKLHPSPESYLYGWCDTDKLIIYVALPTEDQNFRDTVYHETIHAIADAMGIHLSETKVRYLTSLLIPAIDDLEELCQKR